MINKVTLIGRIGKEIELKYLPNGTAVTQLSLATEEKWMKDGQKQSRTEWHRVNVFGKTAEHCNQYLKKGSLIFVEGKIQTRSWEKENVKHYSTEIVAQLIKFLDTKKEGGNAAPGQQSAPEENYQIETNASFAADEIPF